MACMKWGLIYSARYKYWMSEDKCSEGKTQTHLYIIHGYYNFKKKDLVIKSFKAKYKQTS